MQVPLTAAKLKATLTHATLNDAVVGIAAYNWFVELFHPIMSHHLIDCPLDEQVGSSSIEEFDSSQNERTPFYSVSNSKGPSLFSTLTDDDPPHPLTQRSSHILLLGLPRRCVTVFSQLSMAGNADWSYHRTGKLVYTYGMGVQRQGEAAEMKKKMEKS